MFVQLGVGEGREWILRAVKFEQNSNIAFGELLDSVKEGDEYADDRVVVEDLFGDSDWVDRARVHGGDRGEVQQAGEGEGEGEQEDGGGEEDDGRVGE